MNCDEIKEGDSVFLHIGPGSQILTVDRVLKLHIICGNSKYRRHDGYKVGASGFHRPHITPATAEQINAARQKERQQNLAWEISQTKWALIPIDTLRQIKVLLQ